jgi:hypothetical protein
MEPGSADYTTTNSNCTCGCYWRCTNNCDTIAENNELYIASGTASATGTINDNDAAQL